MLHPLFVILLKILYNVLRKRDFMENIKVGDKLNSMMVLWNIPLMKL